ncbi:MAG: DUF5615 family PIN-like protein [Vicinamibacterales bacterium]
MARAAKCGVPIYTSSPGDSSIGMNVAYHELMNGGRLMIDPNKDVNEICAIILAGQKNGAVILGGGSPKNFYLQGQPTLWEVYGIPKGGNDYFIQITTDQVVWGGLRRHAGRSRELGEGQPGRAARHRRRLLRLHHRVPALLRVRRRSPQRPPDPEEAGRTPGRDGRLPREAGAAPHRPPEGWRLTQGRWGTLWSELGPLADGAADHARVYADANVPAGLVRFMRETLGWDVLFVMEHPDLRRARDDEHYRLARQLRRTLVTLDRDYLDDRRFPPQQGAGVLVIAAPHARGFEVPSPVWTPGCSRRRPAPCPRGA